MADGKKKVTRRTFTKKAAATTAGAAAAPALFHIVPPNCLAQNGKPSPNETFGGCLIGVGGRGPGTYKGMTKGLNVKKLAECDVKWVGQADNKFRYTDFRRVLERKDIDLVAIATPPHWHALISIAAMEAGKDVLCEKPATRFIAEGRALVEASKRYRRIYQVGTFGRFGKAGNAGSRATHKIIASGLLKDKNPVVWHKKGGFKVKQWSGRANLKPQAPPKNLDWDMYCGPSPIKPYVRPRTGGTHRGYWDYEGGGLCDMGQHYLDPFQWEHAKDDTSPVKIVPNAAPAHPELTGMWSWVEMTYADGMKLVLESGEWGEPYAGKGRGVSKNDLSKEDQKKLDAMPDPKPLVRFSQAVQTRQLAGGHPEAAHRAVTLLHLANLAIRTGRQLNYDPVKEQFINDEEANRLINPPMRAPWHL